MSSSRCAKIANLFIKTHVDWVLDGRLLSWARRLGIELNDEGQLDEKHLFNLFVLAALWNNAPTYKAEVGEHVFSTIKYDYTLDHFRRAETDDRILSNLRTIASKEVRNPHIFDLLRFVANGDFQGGDVWREIRRVLELPNIGNEESDESRLKQLYQIFNPRTYNSEAYLTVKVFLIFREMRIQFRESGKYQYSPTICCIPDSNVRKALAELDLTRVNGTDINSLIVEAKTVAEHFCNDNYELYDLPLFFWCRDWTKKGSTSLGTKISPWRGELAGVCPMCGYDLIWRRARESGRLYRGCTNFNGGCRYQERD